MGRGGGVANTVVPLGGSYFFEHLTNKLEEEAMMYIRRIDEMGGIVEAVEKGYPQREIAASAYRFQRQIEVDEPEDDVMTLLAGNSDAPAEDYDEVPALRREDEASGGRPGPELGRHAREEGRASAPDLRSRLLRPFRPGTVGPPRPQIGPVSPRADRARRCVDGGADSAGDDMVDRRLPLRRRQS